jgi:hypothetical protein
MVASGPTEKTEMGEFKLLRDQLWWDAGQEFAWQFDITAFLVVLISAALLESSVIWFTRF